MDSTRAYLLWLGDIPKFLARTKCGAERPMPLQSLISATRKHN
jgi:hypothetical protein